MSFEINPCHACTKVYGKDANINTLNNCVTNVATAFGGIPSNNIISGTIAGKNWYGCMSQSKNEIERTDCDMHLDMAPVFVQAPHYFPELLVKHKNPEHAKRDCLKQCSSHRHNRQECMQNCFIDREAVLGQSKNLDAENTDKTDKSDTKKSPYPFLLGGIAVFILLVVGVLLTTKHY